MLQDSGLEFTLSFLSRSASEGRMPFKRFKYIIMQLRVSNDSRVKHGTPSKQKKKNRKNKKLRQSQPGVVIGLESWSSRVESRSPSSRPRSTLEHQPSRLVEVSRRRTPPVSRWRCQGLKGRQGKVRLAWEPVINEPWTREFFQPFLNLCASEGKQNLNAKK